MGVRRCTYRPRPTLHLFPTHVLGMDVLLKDVDMLDQVLVRLEIAVLDSPDRIKTGTRGTPLVEGVPTSSLAISYMIHEDSTLD